MTAHGYARTILTACFALILSVSFTVPSAAQEHGDGRHDEAVQSGDGHGVDGDAVAGEHAPSHGEGEHAEGHGEGEHDAHSTWNLTPAEEILNILAHKVENTRYIHEYPFPTLELPQGWTINVAGLTIDMSLSRHVIYMWISGLITLVLMWVAARQNGRNKVPRGFGNMIESMVVFVRDEIALPFLGHDATRFLPLLLTFFFFITVMNLVGLVPFGAASTGNINVTAGLALITFGVMIIGGMKSNGIIGFWKGLVPSGIPAVIGVLMFVIEILGLLIKPFALAVRLFANMLSGGLVIGAFYALIFGMDTVLVAPLSIAFLLFMSMLKIFISFLQAYIFTMLSTFFIGMSLHQDH